MLNFLRVMGRRSLRLLVTLIAASTALFLLVRVIPGDPARVIAGIEGASNPKTIEAIRTQLGLDAPLGLQFLRWIRATLSFDFGLSFQQNRPVTRLLFERMGITLTLAIGGMLVALFLAIPGGMISAVSRNGKTDRVITGSAHLLQAIPEFWLGIMLLLLFSVAWRIFPLFGSDGIKSFVLPVLALGLGRAAFLLRLVRSSVLRELQKDYVRFFSQLGVPRVRLLVRHVLPNAIIPIVIPAGIQFGYLLGGAIIIEQVFGMGGLGRLLLQAIQGRDFPLLQGIVILFALVFSLVNFLADLIAVFGDPRSRI